MNKSSKPLFIFLILGIGLLVSGYKQFSEIKYTLLDATMACCENGTCDGTDCDNYNVYAAIKPDHCSPEIQITCRECMDAIRYDRTCSGTTRYTYCIDNSMGGVRYSSWCGYESPLNISIGGPGYLALGANGYFSSSTTGGCTASFPNHYQWYLYYPCNEEMLALKEKSNTEIIDALPCGVWDPFGSDSPSITRSDTKNFWLKCVVSNNYNPNATSNIWTVEIVDE